MKAIRVGFGLLAATLATPIAIAVVFLARWRFETGAWASQPWPVVEDRILLYAMLSAPVALFLTVGFGAPLTHRRAELGRATALRTALTGAALGAMPFLIFDGYVIGMNLLLLASEPYSRETLLTAARWAALGSWCGFWSALAYWVVAIGLGRDRQQPR
jgi:hypothetical protein